MGNNWLRIAECVNIQDFIDILMFNTSIKCKINVIHYILLPVYQCHVVNALWKRHRLGTSIMLDFNINFIHLVHLFHFGENSWSSLVLWSYTAAFVAMLTLKCKSDTWLIFSVLYRVNLLRVSILAIPSSNYSS